MLVSFGLVGAGLSSAAAVLLPPSFTAKAQLVVESPGLRSTSLLDDAAIDTRVELLSSPSHLMHVLDALSKDRVHGAADSSPLSYETLVFNLKAYKERHSRVIAVTYKSTDPAFAARVANTSVEVFLADLDDRRRAEHEMITSSLDRQIPLLRTRVQQAETALERLLTESGLSEQKHASAWGEEIAQLTRQLAISRSELAQHRTHLEALRSAKIGSGKLDLFGLRHDPLLGEIILRYISVPSGAVAAGSSASADHEREVREKIERAINDNVTRLSEEMSTIHSRAKQLEMRLQTVRAAEAMARGPESSLLEMQRQATALGQVYQALLQRQKELATQGPMPIDVRLASRAMPPEIPSSPNLLLFVAPAALFSMMIAAGLVVLFDHLDPTMRNQREVSEALGIKCVSLLPSVRSTKRRPAALLLSKKPFSPYTEAIRSTAASLSGLGLGSGKTDPGPRLLLITSSVAREGKTTLAVGIAAYASLTKRKVLLIGASGCTPDFCEAVGTRPGATNLLRTASFSERVRTHAMLGFDYLIMPRGHLETTELLDSVEIRSMLLHIGDGYDLVVIDGASLLDSTETRVLCAAVDVTLLAVRWGSTRRETTQHALRSIEMLVPLRGPVLAVLTRVNLKRHASYRFGDIGQELALRKA